MAAATPPLTWSDALAATAQAWADACVDEQAPAGAIEVEAAAPDPSPEPNGELALARVAHQIKDYRVTRAHALEADAESRSRLTLEGVIVLESGLLSATILVMVIIVAFILLAGTFTLLCYALVLPQHLPALLGASGRRESLRAVVRTSRMLAAFAHASNNTSPVVPSKINNICRAPEVSCSSTLAVRASPRSKS